MARVVRVSGFIRWKSKGDALRNNKPGRDGARRGTSSYLAGALTNRPRPGTNILHRRFRAADPSGGDTKCRDTVRGTAVPLVVAA